MTKSGLLQDARHQDMVFCMARRISKVFCEFPFERGSNDSRPVCGGWRDASKSEYSFFFTTAKEHLYCTIEKRDVLTKVRP
jgi:hypothetical protein